METVEGGVGEAGGDVFKSVAAARLNRVHLTMQIIPSLLDLEPPSPFSHPFPGLSCWSPVTCCPRHTLSAVPPTHTHTVPSHLPPHRLYCTPDLTMRLRSTRASVSPR